MLASPLLAAGYVQDLDPLGNRLASTVVAALPVLVLFYLLVGRRWVASAAGATGAALAVLLAWLVYGMPLGSAVAAFGNGVAFGLLPIGLTVFSAMLIYNLSVETGHFAVIHRSIGGLSQDARVQAVLIGFCFGAFLEGAAGSGSPVAIGGAMLVGFGVPPFRAAVICLIANTSPVCYGGLGTPVLTLSGTANLPADTISHMCGHQLPFLSCLIPLYMVKCLCSWRDTLAIWPVVAVGGGSFAVFQYTFATMHTWGLGLPVVWPMTDIGGGIFSLVCLALFLRFVWRPKDAWKFPAGEAGAGQTADLARPHDRRVAEAEDQVASVLPAGRGMADRDEPLTTRRVLIAWSPFILMSLCLGASGLVKDWEKSGPIDLGFAKSIYSYPLPALHKEVERAAKLQKLVTPELAASVVGGTAPGATPDVFGTSGVRVKETEAAEYKLPWITTPGMAVVVATLLSVVVLRASPAVCRKVLKKTVVQMKIPIPTITCMIGLSYVTKYAGMDATLGVAFAETGVLYPFFAAILGWLGVFLTGTDAGSNALFGSLQKITAGQVYEAGHLPHLTRGQAELLICTANSTGGVMGKMIDAQSICVATAGTNQIGKEADIFKAVIWHSIFLACVVGGMTALQAFVPPFTSMVPQP
jgi:lactate permease